MCVMKVRTKLQITGRFTPHVDRGRQSQTSVGAVYPPTPPTPTPQGGLPPIPHPSPFSFSFPNENYQVKTQVSR